jgi:hypothetical protein
MKMAATTQAAAFPAAFPASFRSAATAHMGRLGRTGRFTASRNATVDLGQHNGHGGLAASPRHLPLPTYGVQILEAEQNLTLRVVKAARYLGLLLQRSLFQIRSLSELFFQLPVWLIQLQRQRRGGQPRGGRSI